MSLLFKPGEYRTQRSVVRKLALLFGFLLVAFSLTTPTSVAFAQGKSAEAQKDKRWNLRREERLKAYRDETGKVRPDKWKQGIEHYKNMEFTAGVSRFSSSSGNDSAAMSPSAGSGLSGVQWVQVGPKPAFPIESINYQGNGAMSGEVLDIAIDPRNFSDDVIYSVTNDGGVWRSTDGGVTFQQKTDNMPSLSMGAIVLDPINPSIVYAGTGNLYDGNGWMTTLAVKAVGIYRSIDMGESWTVLNPNEIFTGRGIARMAMPAGDVLLVGTSNGLFKSVNGGMTFGRAPTYDDGNPIIGGFVEDIDLDTTDPANTVYASVNGQGIFRSTDQGDTFPDNLFTNSNGSPEDVPTNGAYAYVRMAQGVSDPDRMYATVQSSGGGFDGLYRSDDRGDNWTVLPAAAAPGAANGGCQCGYDQTVGVDPQDHQRVFIGFQELYASTDGGATFGGAVSANKIHWDHHFIGFSPPSHWGGAAAPTPMWVGTDGGIHSTSDGGATFNNFHNSTIASNLFHHMDIGRGSAANNDWTYGGTQDTGTLHSCAPAGSCGLAASISGPVPWEMGNNGDGTGVKVDPTDPLRAYGVRNGDYRFTNDGGQTWINPDQTDPDNPVPPTAWRFAIDFHDSTRVWAITSTRSGFQPGPGLWRSNDASGINWSNITTFTSNVRAIANTITDSNVLWFGHVNGNVQYTLDATATNPTFSGLIAVDGAPAGSAVSDVVINPLNTDEVIVTYLNMCGAPCNNPDNRMRRIFRTTDRGLSWSDISGTDGNPVGNLPNLPTHSVVYDIGTLPPSIVVANDAGVLRSSNNGATWQKLGLGLPTADSKMLQIDDGVEPPVLRLATYGRSIWELAEAQGPILAVNSDLGFDMACIDERQSRIVQLFNVGSEPLIVNAIFRAEGSAEIKIYAPSTPFTIQPGEEVDFTVEFLAQTAGDHTATIQINSNDQFEPSFQISASGTINTQMISTVIADVGSFGGVCTTNDFHDLDLLIANPGCGLLEVSGIAISGADSSDFDMAGVMDFPLQVAEGDSIAVPIRFDPSGTCGGTRNATLEIASDDPNTPVKEVDVSGEVPCPDINVSIADSGDFGDVCKTDHADLDITLFNQGQCDLTITGISSDNPLFVLPDDLQTPLVLSHDADFMLPIRYAPVNCNDSGDSGTITIVSDSPGEGSVDVSVNGLSPCPQLVIDPAGLESLYAFPATVSDSTGSLGCFEERNVTLRNNGECPLTIGNISAVGTSGDPLDYAVTAPTQFPIILPTGEETLDVTVQFTPQADADPLAPSEVLGLLTVQSDDPDGDGLGDLCGESTAQSGIRVLTTDISSGVPLVVDEVDNITIRSKGKRTSSPINLQFTDVVPQTTDICGNTVTWHVDQETLPNAQTTGSDPKSSYQVSSKEGNLQDSQSFSLNQCDFLEFQLQLLNSDAPACLLLPKGAACATAGECCSGKCKGPVGGMTCK
jgi:hypothetical protein